MKTIDSLGPREIARVFMPFDELALGLRVNLGRRGGRRFLPREADAMHQLDKTRLALVEVEPVEDERVATSVGSAAQARSSSILTSERSLTLPFLSKA